MMGMMVVVGVEGNVGIGHAPIRLNIVGRTHDSASCNNKKQGHVDTATFANKRGGSTRFCNSRE